MLEILKSLVLGIAVIGINLFFLIKLLKFVFKNEEKLAELGKYKKKNRILILLTGKTVAIIMFLVIMLYKIKIQIFWFFLGGTLVISLFFLSVSLIYLKTNKKGENAES